MELDQQRSPSTPANSSQIPLHERFTLTDAAQLKLQLEALNDKVDSDADIETLKSACQARPFQESLYIDGSEFFYLAVRNCPRPDLIPKVYIEAFATMQQGRFPINQYTVSDSRKGMDPTFSQVRALLPKIDKRCGTGLAESVFALEDRVKPFPFLKLPAELRLHIYSRLWQREAHVAIMNKARDCKPPRVNLDIMRTNKQMYQETFKYFYENRTLFMIAARDPRHNLELSNEYISRHYETVFSIGQAARELFTRFEIHIGFLGDQTIDDPKHPRVPSTDDPLREIFKLLPNLKTVVISIRSLPMAKSDTNSSWDRERTVQWIMHRVPPNVEVLWAPGGLVLLVEAAAEEVMRIEQAILWHRGTIKIGESCTELPEASKAENARVYEYKDRGTVEVSCGTTV